MAVALTLEYLFLWFLLYAFIGWVYESVLVSVSERRWVNRSFLNGPLCPIYGCGAVLAIVLLHDFTNPIEIFLISSFGASILEYITSWGMEKLFHARWWDYSHYRFNIQGRICLLGAIVFGFGGVLIIDVVQPQVERLTAMIPLLAVHVICAVAAIVDYHRHHRHRGGYRRPVRASRQIQRSGAGACGEGRRLLAVGQRGIPREDA